MAIDNGTYWTSTATSVEKLNSGFTQFADTTTAAKITVDDLRNAMATPKQQLNDAVREAMETYLRDEGIIAPHEGIAKQKDINEELRRQIQVERELHRAELVDQQTEAHMLKKRVEELEKSLDLATKALSISLQASEEGVEMSLKELMEELSAKVSEKSDDKKTAWTLPVDDLYKYITDGIVSTSRIAGTSPPYTININTV